MYSNLIIGQRIRMTRLNLNITRKELAEVAYVSSYSIANYEVGRRMPDIETLCLIADYFGMALDELIGRVPPEEPKMKRNAK